MCLRRRAPVTSPAAAKKIEPDGKSVPFRGPRTILAAIGGTIALVIVAAFVWWYVGTVKELDTAADVAVERRSATIERGGGASDPGNGGGQARGRGGLGREPGGPTAKSNEGAGHGRDRRHGRRRRDRATRTGGRGKPRNSLTLGLKITNRSDKPLKYAGWSRPEIKVLLRDLYGNSYNRISPGPQKDVEIKPGETIDDKLVFEPTAFNAEVSLDLPLPDGGKSFLFLIPAAFITRTPPPTVATTKQAPAAAPSPATPNAAPKTAAAVVPTTKGAYDPETDAKLCGKSARTITSRWPRSIGKLGKGSNESILFKRRETAKLMKRLAKDHELTDDQVKRIVAQKG